MRASWASIYVSAPLFTLALIIPFAIGLYNLNQPLLETNEFRQTQTALTAWMFVEDGIDLLNYTTPIFGAPWRVPFELPVYQAASALIAKMGLIPLDASLRLTALLFFYLSAFALSVLVSNFGGSQLLTRTIVITYVWMPFCIQSARLCLIDYSSVFFALTYVALLHHFVARRSSASFFFFTAVFGSLAFTTKLTTMAAFIPLAIGLVIRMWVNCSREFGSTVIRKSWKRLLPPCAAILLLIVPLIVGKLWINHTDAVKLSGDFTQKLASENLTEWNFGTVEQRMEVENWTRILDRIRYWVCPKFTLFLPLAAFVGFPKESRQSQLLLATSVLGAVLPIVVFFNLYVIHDYYLIAITPLLAVLMGAGLLKVFVMLGTVPNVALRHVLAFGVIVCMAISIDSAKEYPLRTIRKDVRQHWAFLVGEEIQRNSTPDENLLIWSDNWGATVPYYSKRKSLFIGPRVSEVEMRNPVPVDQALFRHMQGTKYQLLVGRNIPTELVAAIGQARLISETSGYSLYRIHD